ncbi:MAG: preprotein translocase subunit SecE [Candidatus Moranbacteria bacterium]|nr:preprotein translocase subunit SecE [Candidatus Moranbacteria bacterium]
MEKALIFLKEAKVELLKVAWPTKEQLIRNTVLVVVISLSMAIFLGALDYAFSWLVETFLF